MRLGLKPGPQRLPPFTIIVPVSFNSMHVVDAVFFLFAKPNQEVNLTQYNTRFNDTPRDSPKRALQTGTYTEGKPNNG
jgi:hypothetical protein